MNYSYHFGMEVLEKQRGRLQSRDVGLVVEGPWLGVGSEPKLRDVGPRLLIPRPPRSHETQVLDSYVYEDTDDLFAREPFVAQFTFPSKGRKGRRLEQEGGAGRLAGGHVPGEEAGWGVPESGWQSSVPGALQSFPAWCWSHCTPLRRPWSKS